ncbi:MAG: NADH-quinone oxidoreductase subunit C [Clostridiales Family XIII bacterium]|jgi:ech hydrogenase subunit D|nr:NADH-quinone oxidoreductase subunit C [Clostridiales Family XIII bacterium]
MINKSNPENILSIADSLFEDGFRIAQICAYNGDNEVIIIYSFDKKGVIKNIEVPLKAPYQIDSISSIYLAAFIYENEMHDLFGINFKNSKIDYSGKFFKLSRKTPWKGDK